MVQPLGFIDQIFPTICVIFVKLSMVLSKLHEHGTLNYHLGTSLFVYNTKDLVLYLLVCVDDFILIGNDLGFINKFFSQLAT